MNENRVDPALEKPISDTSRVVLTGAATGTILLFYLFTLASILALLALLAVELAALLVLARFGAARLITPALREHLAPMPIFVRSLRIRKRPEFKISLTSAEAPGFFSILKKLCERVQVKMPHTVALEMTCGAWVQLDGYWRGTGRTTLGIGFDLLAGLSEGEVEGVLAHEMMHAKLVHRGFNKWLRGGLSRAVQLASGLGAQAGAARQARRSAGMTNFFLNGADWLARRCAQFVAGCSRQDEFAADLGATRFCAPGMLQSALLKLEAIERNAARLPWRERIAQLQSGEGFGNWLVQELAAPGAIEPRGLKGQLRSKYSTHPALADRLAALPPVPTLPANPIAGLRLLAEPDSVAEKLVTEIQRVVAREEQKDSRNLDRWSRKIRAHSNLQPIQSLGIVLAALGFIAGPITLLTAGFSPGLLLFCLITIVPGMLGYRFGGYREGKALPVPDFATLKAAAEAKPVYQKERAEQFQTELTQRISKEKKRSQRVRLLVDECYLALANCEYLRAQSAATLCLRENTNSVEAVSARGIAAAALGDSQQVTWALQILQKRTRFAGRSAAWAAAWIFVLCGNWEGAEALLAEARKGRLKNPTLLALLALCQARRGKLQSAIISSRRACSSAPPDKEYAKQLISLLLDGGYLRAAGEQLDKLAAECRADSELVFSMLRLKLQSRKVLEAQEWAALFQERNREPHTLVRLGGLYEAARYREQAHEYYDRSLVAAHFPEALLGLARLHADRQNEPEAERWLLAALNFQKAPGAGGAGALQIFQPALNQLLMLREPLPDCLAWLATLNTGSAPREIARYSYLIFALNQQEAGEHLSRILVALQPQLPPPVPSSITWRKAPKERQPLGPVRPGVQCLVE
jgi:Zn-dependent protease with chaperone function/tetratricopeptide (TPR) repeat protein